MSTYNSSKQINKASASWCQMHSYCISRYQVWIRKPVEELTVHSVIVVAPTLIGPRSFTTSLFCTYVILTNVSELTQTCLQYRSTENDYEMKLPSLIWFKLRWRSLCNPNANQLAVERIFPTIKQNLGSIYGRINIINDYYDCLIECDDRQATCKRICREVLRDHPVGWYKKLSYKGG